MKNKIVQRILGIALFVMGIVFCAAAFLGHEPAYSAAVCCFVAIPVLLRNMQKK